jgi:hypothetical protein
VTLLHSHFRIENDEILVEQVDADEDLITLRPLRNNPSTLFATNLCFDEIDRGAGPLLIGLEFAPRQVLAGVTPIGETDRAVLTGLGGILRRMGKSGRFGVRLLHDPLKLNGEALFETCDSSQRVLTCRRGAENDPSLAQSVATVFRWEENRQSGEGVCWLDKNRCSFAAESSAA